MSDYAELKLKARHIELENSISEEQRKRAPNTLRLRELKKQKLAIRDQLQHFIARPTPAQLHAHSAS